MPDGMTPAPRQHDTLAGALAAAQGDLPHIRKDQTAKIGPGREYRYADLATVLAAVRPVLSRHGLALVQRTDIRDGAVVLLTELRHPSGEILDTLYPVAQCGARHQEMGGALTYARRYAVCSLLGIAADEDDDGATAAETPPARQSKPVEDQLKARAQRAIAALDAAASDKAEAVAKRAETVWDELLEAGLASSAALLRQSIEEARARAGTGAFS